MKAKKILIGLLTGVFLLFVLFFLVINIVDLVNVFKHSGEYPFESAFFSKYSIYRSRNTYILFQLISVFFLILTAFFAFKRKWKMFFIVFSFDIVLLLYPVLTNA